jgi:hypothetical protein
VTRESASEAASVPATKTTGVSATVLGKGTWGQSQGTGQGEEPRESEPRGRD